MSEVASAYVSLIPSYRGGTRQIAGQLNGPSSQAGREGGRRYGAGLLGGLSSMRGQITGLVGGLLAFKGVSAAISFAKDSIFGFNSQLEQSTIAFTTMLGSGKRASAFLDQLKTFAKSTPFEFPDLVRSSQRLIAMGIASKDVIPYLTGIGDAVAGLGGGREQIDQVTTAIGQMSAKGKIQSDELLQLTEAGIPALKILADQYHVSAGKMQEMITAGKVMSADALPKLIAGLEHGTSSTAAFGGMMSKQSQTFGGALSNIKDSLSQSLASAFLPFFQSTSSGLQRFAGFLSGPTFTRASARFTATLSGGMSSASSVLKSLAPIASKVFNGALLPAFRTAQSVLPQVVAAFRNLWATVKPLASTLAGVLFAGFRAVLSAVQQLAPVVLSVTGFLRAHKTIVGTLAVVIGTAVLAWKAWQFGIAAWSAVTKVAAAVQEAFNTVLAANPIGLVIIAIAALAAGMVYAYNKSATFRAIVQAAFTGIKIAASAVANFFTTTLPHAFMAVYNGLKSAWNAAVGFLKTWGPVALAVLVPFIGLPLVIWQHFGKIKGFLGSAFSGAYNTVKGWIANIVSAVAGIPGKIAGLAGRLMSAGKSFMGGLFDGIRGALTGAGRWAGNLGSSIVNSVKNALNSFLHLPLRLPRINTHIPGVGTVGGQTLIPALAKGGVIPATPGGRLVRVAEAGQAEAVIPLNRFKDFGLSGGGDAPVVGELTINEVSDPVSTARAVTRRLSALVA